MRVPANNKHLFRGHKTASWSISIESTTCKVTDKIIRKKRHSCEMTLPKFLDFYDVLFWWPASFLNTSLGTIKNRVISCKLRCMQRSPLKLETYAITVQKTSRDFFESLIFYVIRIRVQINYSVPEHSSGFHILVTRIFPILKRRGQKLETIKQIGAYPT